jgi:hypothetical protein
MSLRLWEVLGEGWEEIEDLSSVVDEPTTDPVAKFISEDDVVSDCDAITILVTIVFKIRPKIRVQPK